MAPIGPHLPIRYLSEELVISAGQLQLAVRLRSNYKFSLYLHRNFPQRPESKHHISNFTKEVARESF